MAFVAGRRAGAAALALIGAGAATCALACAGAGCAGPRAASRSRDAALETRPATEALPAMTQELMNALPGDATVWRRYLSDRFVLVSEANEVQSKEELIGSFGPFPPGLSGTIEVRNERIAEHGDVAVIVFDAHEQETVYDQQIEVDYRSTCTWRREGGRWRLLAMQIAVVEKDPTALPIDAARLDAIVGTYTLAGERRYRVERRGDALVGGPEDGELKALIAVGDNVFAVADNPLGVLQIFVAGPDGTIERMVQRRNTADLDWMRVR
jgi:hypothetical protein